MQLGIRLHDTKKLPFEERIADVREMGFSCGHLALAKVIDEFSTKDEALTPGLAMYIKNVFAKNHVDIAVLGCYLNLANPNEEQLKKTMHRYMTHIRFASWLGCGVVGTETGCPNETYSFVPECHNEEALALFIRNMRPIVEYAEKMGVCMAIEPVASHIVSTSARARRVLDEIGSPNLQIILDPVNLLADWNYQNADTIIDEAIALLGEDVAVVHIKDYKVKDGKVMSLAAGLGEMNYKPLLKWMKEKKPFIQATLEDTNPENNMQAKEYIQRLYAEV